MFTFKMIRDYENSHKNNHLPLLHEVNTSLPLSPKVNTSLPLSPKIKELIKRTESWDNFIKIQWPWVI
jgi:hypothetical protein